MAGRFDWETNGLDRAKFEALTKLLRLRYHGQVGAPTRFDESHLYTPDDGDLALDDADSTKVSTLADFGSSRLQRAFLDRLAELVANEKGGRHVSATLMTNSHDEVRVFVARNSKFRPRDEAFMKCTEALLRRIAEGQDISSRDELWALILKHYEARIHDYICDLRQVLKRYMQGEQRESPSQLVAHLRELCDAAFAQYVSNTEKSEVLVAQAHELYKTFSEDDFSEVWPSGSRSLRACLGFLGRVRTSFGVLVRAAEKLPGIATISISTVGCVAPRKASSSEHGQIWTLGRLFQHLGCAFTDDGVNDLLAPEGKRPRWTKRKLAQEFDKLQSSTWEVHAEMQLLQLYIHPPKIGSVGSSAVDYIGCSKKSCFLCWHFLALFGGVKTRGSHGKLYNLWGLPDFQGLPMAQMEQIIRSVRDLESLLRAEIKSRDTVVLPQAKESTVGASTISTVLPGSNVPSTTSMISSYLQNQRANLLVKASSSEGASYSDNETETEQSITEVVATSGHCGGSDCEKITTRRCSHCSGTWFCSVSCEDEAADLHLFACNRRPITTADLLRRDCFHDSHPEDSRVREDYGFQRCRNRREESKLFGLYIGVFNYQLVPSQEVDRWMTQGILADKIIELFSTLPENCRGGYYTWFLRHRHVLDASKNSTRDEDDVHNYIQERFREARVYLDPADQAKPIERLTPWAKQNCFFFLTLLLDSTHPPPVMRNLDLWFDFGYVVCSDAYDENSLSNLYQRLLFGNKLAQEHFRSVGMEHLAPRDIPACTFEEFWTAWEEGSLMALFERYQVSRVADGSALGEFLAYPGGNPRPSVWRLRHFLAIEDANVLTAAPEIAAAAIEYGFQPDLDVRTKMGLHQFYVGLFRRGVLPSIVHEAKKTGALQKVPEWALTDADERVTRVLSSLPCDSEFEGLQSSGGSRGGETRGWGCMVM
ncbi:uncharacterized protein B0H64DRAFT_81498 [Chaetomium fimeti]|uniref:MYND-type domain-containing protein n=1 Tax=Chaetomium fimeti TaxID=1854472 RepID=A0AAE0LVU1_9PEZI|nr:hypothetical protein B0H64DRAFT_81498 [Chaetomium fimeti]